MKLKIDVLEESIKQIVREESEYQEFFKKALEKAGKSIPQMSDEEKKAFFNKIDAAWKAKGEKNESVNEAKNLGDILKLDVARELGVMSSLLDIEMGFTPNTKDGNKLFVIRLDKKVKTLADYFGRAVQYGGYLLVKANGSSGKLIKVIGRFDNKQDIKFSKYINESVNEVASRTAMEIGGLTGMNKDAIQKFVDSNELDIEKVFQFVKKGKLKATMDLVTAIAGKPNNPVQKKLIKMFKESVNEAKEVKVASRAGFIANNVFKDSYKKAGKQTSTLSFKFKKDEYRQNFIDDLKGAGVDEKDIKESVNEGKKAFRVNPQIGKAKYSISFHDGKSKHKDGSDFWGIDIFKNKVDLKKAIKNYKSKGFVAESVVNEEIKVGSSVIVNYPTLKKPIKGKVKHILKSPTGLVYVLDGDKGVWDDKTVSLKESVNESATKAIDMLLKNKGVKDAIRNDKVKVIRKALEDEGFNTKGISDKDILTLAKNLQNESVNESLKKFDDVHIKSKNLSGMVVGIRGNTLVVRTIDGLVKAKKNDVTKIQNDNINEDFGTIALGVAGGLLLLKVLKFVAKKIIGGVARNAPLGKEPLYTTIDSMTKELIKVKTKDPNGKLKDVSLMDIVKLQVVLKELVDKGQIKTMKDIQNIIAKASKR